jgi:hypothetical protein
MPWAELAAEVLRMTPEERRREVRAVGPREVPAVYPVGCEMASYTIVGPSGVQVEEGNLVLRLL